MDRSERRKVCGLILGLVVKDGELSDEESAFVDRLVTAFGLAGADEPWLRPITDVEQAAKTLRALPPEAQRETLDLLIEAAATDGTIAPAERAYLDAVGEVVGWSPDEVGARVEAIVRAAKLR